MVGDVRQALKQPVQPAEVFQPWAVGFWPLLHVAVKTDGTPGVLPRLRERLRREIPDQPIAQLAPMTDLLDTESARDRALAGVMTACGATAALLAMIGLYGLLAGEMSARRREVGIRLALGARRWRLRAWLVRPGLSLTAVAVAVGLALSVPAARLLGIRLLGVAEIDPRTLMLAALLLMAAGIVTALIPAWRLVGARAMASLRYQ